MRTLVIAGLLAASTTATAAPCARPKTLPSELPLVDCPKVTCLAGCDRRGHIVTELVYESPAPKLVARWNDALRAAGWTVTTTPGSFEARRGHDVMVTKVSGGKQITLTVTLIPG